MSTNFIKLDLCRIWLVIFVTILQIYLIFNSIKEYLDLKSISVDPLYGSDWNQGPLGFKLSCLLCSITFLPLIIITSVIVTDNLANDSHVLGQDIDNNHFLIDSDLKGQIVVVNPYRTKGSQYNIFCHSQRFFKQQFVPISIFLQILSGFCYLLPLPFIEAQKLEHRAIGSNLLWHTDLDFIIDTDKNHEDFANGDRYQLPMRPAYFNMIFCFSLLSFRYPSVFWRTNLKFSLLFYFIIVILSFHVLIDNTATSLLIRISVPGLLSEDLVPKIHPIVICMISFLGSMILVILQMTIFNYGIRQYLSSLAEHRQNLRLHFKAQQCKKSTEHDNCSNTSMGSADNYLSDSTEKYSGSSFCTLYCAHISAILIGSLAMGMKIPLLLHEWKVYQRTGDRVMIANVVVAIAFSSVWLITWFGFTLNNHWKFNVNFRSKNGVESMRGRKNSYEGGTCSPPPTTSINTLNTAALLANAGSPMYATCYPMTTSSLNRSLVSPNHRNSNQLKSEEGDHSSCYNYVLLHSGNNAPSVTNSQNTNVSNYPSIIRQAKKPRDSASPNSNNLDGNMITTDDFYGSDRSSESNFSRSLNAQDKKLSDGTVTKLLANRYGSVENPSSKRVPFVRSPLLSYQFSADSSPSDHSRKLANINPFPKVTFTDQYAGDEPELISKKYHLLAMNDVTCRVEMNNPNPNLDQMRTEFLRADSTLGHDYMKELMTSSPNSINENVIIRGNNKVDKTSSNSNSMSKDFLMKLNGLDDPNDEEGRLCSQV